MGLAGETFNRVVLPCFDIEADDHCEEIYQNRKSYLKEVRSIVKQLSMVPPEFSYFWELESTQNTLALLADFEKKCAFSINYEKGTVSLKRWAQIIDEFNKERLS